MSPADAGALGDPLVVGVHDLRQVIVGDLARGQVAGRWVILFGSLGILFGKLVILFGKLVILFGSLGILFGLNGDFPGRLGILMDFLWFRPFKKAHSS